jgi:hypothetical protein
MATKKKEEAKSEEVVSLIDEANTAASPEVQPRRVSTDNGTQSFEESSMEKVTATEFTQGAQEFDNADPTKLVRTDTIETPVVVREKRIIDESIVDVDAYLERLKTTNPRKHELKKEELANRKVNGA